MNEVKLHYYLQHGCFFENIINYSGCIYTFNDVMECFIWNHCFPYKKISNINLLIESIYQFYKTRGRNPCVYLDESTRTDEIVSCLLANNYKLSDEEVWMKYTLAVNEHMKDKMNLIETRVRNDETLLDFLTVCSECFGEQYSTVIKREFKRYQVHKKFEHFIFYYDGQAVSTTSVYSIENNFIIHNVGVVSNYRMQGFAKQTVQKTINIIYSECEYPNIILQCDGGGFIEKFYLNMGFETFYKRWGYVKYE